MIARHIIYLERFAHLHVFRLELHLDVPNRYRLRVRYLLAEEDIEYVLVRLRNLQQLDVLPRQVVVLTRCKANALPLLDGIDLEIARVAEYESGILDNLDEPHVVAELDGADEGRFGLDDFGVELEHHNFLFREEYDIIF